MISQRKRLKCRKNGVRTCIVWESRKLLQRRQKGILIAGKFTSRNALLIVPLAG